PQLLLDRPAPTLSVAFLALLREEDAAFGDALQTFLAMAVARKLRLEQGIEHTAERQRHQYGNRDERHFRWQSGEKLSQGRPPGLLPRRARRRAGSPRRSSAPAPRTAA